MKNGNVAIISIIFIFIFILLLITFYTFFQINFVSNLIREDLNYICLNLYDLSDTMEYNEIDFLDNNPKEYIQKLLNKNYNSYNIKVENIDYDNNHITVLISYTIIPIVLKDAIGEIEVHIEEKIKFKSIEGVK